MKKILLGTIFFLGSVGVASAQSEDRDPRAPKPQEQVKSGQTAQQNQLNGSRNTSGQSSFKARDKKTATVTPASAAATPKKAATGDNSSKAGKNAVVTPVMEKQKTANKADIKTTDAYKSKESTTSTGSKKN